MVEVDASDHGKAGTKIRVSQVSAELLILSDTEDVRLKAARPHRFAHLRLRKTGAGNRPSALQVEPRSVKRDIAACRCPVPHIMGRLLERYPDGRRSTRAGRRVLLLKGDSCDGEGETGEADVICPPTGVMTVVPLQSGQRSSAHEGGGVGTYHREAEVVLLEVLMSPAALGRRLQPLQCARHSGFAARSREEVNSDAVVRIGAMTPRIKRGVLIHIIRVNVLVFNGKRFTAQIFQVLHEVAELGARGHANACASNTLREGGYGIS
ncbi:MAG: hypothetical protein LUO89_12555 [Methanothrix sp.]|nr:hypothetical protein [Methanothrix sp.]